VGQADVVREVLQTIVMKTLNFETGVFGASFRAYRFLSSSQHQLSDIVDESCWCDCLDAAAPGSDMQTDNGAAEGEQYG